MARRDDKLDAPPPPLPGPWVEKAACAALVRNPRYEWFPEEEEWDRPEVHRARATCNQCPVRAECARYAIDNKVPHGMWGGLSEEDRGFFPVKVRKRREPVKREPKCPGCGSKSWIVPKGRAQLTCVKCKATWPAILV